MSLTMASSLALGSGFATNMENGSKACDHVLAAPDTSVCSARANMRAMRSGLVRLSDLTMSATGEATEGAPHFASVSSLTAG